MKRVKCRDGNVRIRLVVVSDHVLGRYDLTVPFRNR